MRGIALNFFPVTTDHFTITLYRLPYVEGKRPQTAGEEAIQRTLEIQGEHARYWTMFQRAEGTEETVCSPFDNVYLTIDALRSALILSCQDNLDANRFRIIEGFRHHVEIITAEHTEGCQVVSLEPYFLRLQKRFGFLADFRFHPTEEYRGTRRALQLSLSLDQHGRPNPNHYADRYSHLVSFVTEFHGRIFPLQIPGGEVVEVDSQPTEISHERLDIKNYVVGPSKESRSQFMGVKQFGPFEKAPEDSHLYFLYREEDRPLSRDLFRALRGDTFSTFPGMERMFHYPISKVNVSGVSLSDFSDHAIDRIRDRIVTDAKGRRVVPIVLTPFSRHDNPDQNAAYWTLKHAFLSERVPIQVVATETVANKNMLKWSIGSIGLQVFSKLGGTPWKVRPRTDPCLIVGIGQSHHVSEGRTERFYAYSVLTDSSGVFKEVRFLGEGRHEGHYIQSFSANLRRIFSDYSSSFSNFVVHATFSIRRNELECVAETLRDQQDRQQGPGEFVSLRFNDRNRFFGFAEDHNSRVPYESSMIPLSRNEYLIWFEGLQYGQSIVRGMIGHPLHVKFTYPFQGLTRERQRAHLQDAINLSGANWRGFNAKSLPVSVYYAQLISKYLKEFERHGLPAVDATILTPWFL